MGVQSLVRMRGSQMPGESGERVDIEALVAPRYESLPDARHCAGRGGPARSSFTLSLEAVTPILGGGVRTRDLDDVDAIRSATNLDGDCSLDV